jgi:hypothetical protein
LAFSINLLNFSGIMFPDDYFSSPYSYTNVSFGGLRITGFSIISSISLTTPAPLRRVDSFEVCKPDLADTIFALNNMHLAPVS